jgi:RimJ/RimL family protein N-acetyltransferase
MTFATLRSLAAADLAILHRWHMEPHLRPHYVWADMSADEIARKFTPRLDPAHTVRCRIAEADGVPYGFVQWYPSWHWPDCGAMRIGLTSTCSADYFIGEPRFLGRGLASAMLRAVTDDVRALMPAGQRTLCIAHDDRNASAIRATTAAGLTAKARYRDGDVGSTVYVSR